MNKFQKIGALILGGVAAFAVLGRQRLTFGVRDIQLAGIITPEIIPLRLVTWIANDTFGSVLVRKLSGSIIYGGNVVATVNQVINKRISSNSYIEQYVYVDLHNQAALAALFDNIGTGDINNLAFEMIGEVTVGEQWPVTLDFNRVFTWEDIQKSL